MPINKKNPRLKEKMKISNRIGSRRITKNMQLPGVGGRIHFVDGQKHSKICRQKGGEQMAHTLNSENSKLKLTGSVLAGSKSYSKTFAVDPEYFEDLDDVDTLITKITPVLDTATISAFTTISEAKYNVA